MSAPRVAIVHELLTQRGGAERVAKRLADMYPEAPVYTLLYDETKLGAWFPRERVRTSDAQKWAGWSMNHHLYLKKFPAAVEAWDFSGFDVVLSSSSAFAHGIITNGRPRHISYVHSPARYLWDSTHDVRERAGHGLLGPLKQWYLDCTFHRLRIWDSEAAERADVLLAPSREVQRRIQLYWRRNSEVLTPPIDDQWFAAPPRGDKEDYLLVVSTLSAYKRIELAITASEKCGKKLKIVGEGPHLSALQSIVGPHTEFLGYVDHDGLIDLYGKARATIFPGHEDFGLVPLESLACGTPVIAFAAGGALETVTPDTGVFFRDATAESLTGAIDELDRRAFDASACRAQAERFRAAAFEQRIRTIVGA